MNTPVINFECVHEYIKLDMDVELALVHKDNVVQIYARQVNIYFKLCLNIMNIHVYYI